MPDEPVCSVEELIAAKLTLRKIREHYEMSAFGGWATLVEAERLIKVEAFQQHGEAAWTRVDET